MDLDQKYFLRTGQQTQPIDLSAIMETRFIESAVRDVGPYS
jgi:hypothetical protein